MPGRWDDDDEAEPWSGDRDEDLDAEDAGDTLPCPLCGREIFDDAEQCPQCGQYIGGSDQPGTGRPLWVVVTVLVVLGAILLTWIF